MYIGTHTSNPLTQPVHTRGTTTTTPDWTDTLPLEFSHTPTATTTTTTVLLLSSQPINKPSAPSRRRGQHARTYSVASGRRRRAWQAGQGRQRQKSKRVKQASRVYACPPSYRQEKRRGAPASPSSLGQATERFRGAHIHTHTHTLSLSLCFHVSFLDRVYSVSPSPALCPRLWMAFFCAKYIGSGWLDCWQDAAGPFAPPYLPTLHSQKYSVPPPPGRGPACVARSRTLQDSDISVLHNPVINPGRRISNLGTPLSSNDERNRQSSWDRES